MRDVSHVRWSGQGYCSSQNQFTHPGHRGHANQQTATKTLGPCGLLTGPTQREAALSLVAPCSGVGRGARLQACLLEHGDPFENGPRVVHHGSLGDLLRVVREVGLVGANARGAVAGAVNCALAFGATAEEADVPARVGRQPAGRL